uniref:Uncharacterized protein n=1 Tax=Glossina palpalis gambiensis TaxID=67801 RepID=A0A1B0AP91_9MUSC
MNICPVTIISRNQLCATGRNPIFSLNVLEINKFDEFHRKQFAVTVFDRTYDLTLGIVTRCWEPESRKRPDSLAGDTVTVSVVINKLYDVVVTGGGGGADGGGGDERLKMLSSPLLLGART